MWNSPRGMKVPRQAHPTWVFYSNPYAFQGVDASPVLLFVCVSVSLHLNIQSTKQNSDKKQFSAKFSVLPSVICYKASAWRHRMWKRISVKCKMLLHHHLFTVSFIIKTWVGKLPYVPSYVQAVTSIDSSWVNCNFSFDWHKLAHTKVSATQQNYVVK